MRLLLALVMVALGTLCSAGCEDEICMSTYRSCSDDCREQPTAYAQQLCIDQCDRDLMLCNDNGR